MTLPRVALLTSSYAPHVGGVERVVARLAAEQQGRGGAPVVLTNRWPASLPSFSEVDGVAVYRERFRFPELRPRHLAGWVVGGRTTRQAVRTVLRDRRAQLVHVHCVSTNGLYALSAARSLGVPLVVTLHGELSMDAGSIYTRSLLMRRTWRALLGRAAVVTGCSQHVVDEAVAEYGPQLRPRIRVVSNGVDVAAVRAALPADAPRPYLLAVGRLVTQKGFDLLLAAYRDAAPEADLIVVGEGPERERLLSQAARLGVADRVRFPGVQPPERVWSLMRGAQAFVLSSRHEPQGLVVLEAMAAGAPVVATRVGGVPETVVDGRNGLLVDGDSVAALADGLRRVRADRPAALARADRAGRDVLASGWDAVADAYQDCYDLALRSG